MTFVVNGFEDNLLIVEDIQKEVSDKLLIVTEKESVPVLLMCDLDRTAAKQNLSFQSKSRILYLTNLTDSSLHKVFMINGKLERTAVITTIK